MIAYEFYWADKRGESHFFAILPERRKNPERITEESVMKWGKIVSPNSGVIYFIQIEVPEVLEKYWKIKKTLLETSAICFSLELSEIKGCDNPKIEPVPNPPIRRASCCKARLRNCSTSLCVHFNRKSTAVRMIWHPLFVGEVPGNILFFSSFLCVTFRLERRHFYFFSLLIPLPYY